MPSSVSGSVALMYLLHIIRTPSAVLLPPIHAATCCHGSPFTKPICENLPEEAVLNGGDVPLQTVALIGALLEFGLNDALRSTISAA